MIKKNTYLVRVISSENEPRLEEISGKEWKQIVSANKNVPKEQKRYFMVSRIPINGGYDRMYIEIPYEEYKSWNSERERLLPHNFNAPFLMAASRFAVKMRKLTCLAYRRSYSLPSNPRL